MKIQNPIFWSHLRSQMRNRSLSVVENRWKNRCYEKKSSFPKIKSYNLYGDQIWAPNSSPAPRYLQKQKTFFPGKKCFSWIDWFWSLRSVPARIAHSLIQGDWLRVANGHWLPIIHGNIIILPCAAPSAADGGWFVRMVWSSVLKMILDHQKI